MHHRIATALFALASLSGTATAGNTYPDQFVDPTFAPLSSPLNWRRIYSSGTVDERGIAISRMPDGSFVTLISVPGGVFGNQIGLVRYGPNGELFSGAFGSGGKVIKDGALVDVRAMTVDSQGRIIVVGTVQVPGSGKDFGVLRFLPNGAVDTGFGIDGRVVVGLEPVVATSDDQPVAVVEQVLSGGITRIVIAGNSLMTTGGGTVQTTSMIGLRVDGTLDPDFGAYVDPGFEGRTTQRYATGHPAYAAGLVKLPNNALLVVGTDVLSGTDTDFGACYFSSPGVPYSNSCSVFAIDEPGPGGSIYDGAAAAVQTSADTFVLAGNASGKMAAIRLKLVGSELQLDTTFVGSAIPGRPNRFVSTTDTTYANDVTVRSDGSLLLAGHMTINSTLYGAMTRLRRNGAPDNSGLFGSNGLAAFRAPTLAGAQSYSTDIAKVLVVADKPMLLGSSPDNTSSASDMDGFLTRLQSDLIFSNGWQ